MMYAVLASLVGWGAILFGLRACLRRWKIRGWVHGAIAASAAGIAIASVIGVVVYATLDQLLGENSILWTLS
jgi:hypothetical protein